ncbi:hypothetical protein LX66_0692 [Chitinophaga japonensis]|uniref:Uncharacterized protein n=2 Tax=Chitinophaga japonensis TaxID=104662 RepID=A0A562TDJ3_CHIJA|nr:hypothetical protein LX66_0692 [Chitinophaga japonensis]
MRSFMFPLTLKYPQMKALLFLLMVVFASAASAYATDGHKTDKPEKCDNHEKCDNNDKPTDTKPAVKATVKPSRVEEYVWMLNREESSSAFEEGELENAVVDLYKWYLQNETKINNNDYLKGGGKALVFPFKVDVKTLQQYFQFIKNNFPGLSEDDLDKIRKPLASRKKYAPVTERDDMESPMSIAVPK